MDPTLAPVAALMDRYCAGDAAAFRALHAALAPRLRGYFLRVARDRALADDLVQQTFLKVHRARAAYRRDGDPLPWIFTIARRVFLDEARRRRRAPLALAGDAHHPPAALDGRPQDVVDGDAPAFPPELVGAALAALAALAPTSRDALVLTKLEGRRIDDAAAAAGTTPGAMRVRVHRACTAPRAALGAVAGVSGRPDRSPGAADTPARPRRGRPRGSSRPEGCSSPGPCDLRLLPSP